MAAWEGTAVKISSVTKTSGEIIEFSDKSPVLICGNAIVGTVIREKKLIEIDSSDVITKDPMNRLGTEIITKDGKKYSLIAYRPEEGKYTVNVKELELYESISIPLSEVREIAIANRDKCILLGWLGGGIGMLGGYGVTELLAKEAGSQVGETNPYLIFPILLVIPAFGLIGWLIGSAQEVTDNYIITAPTDSTATIEEDW